MCSLRHCCCFILYLSLYLENVYIPKAVNLKKMLAISKHQKNVAEFLQLMEFTSKKQVKQLESDTKLYIRTRNVHELAINGVWVYLKVRYWSQYLQKYFIYRGSHNNHNMMKSRIDLLKDLIFEKTSTLQKGFSSSSGFKCRNISLYGHLYQPFSYRNNTETH